MALSPMWGKRVTQTVRWLPMTDNDITKLVRFGENDGECLPLEKCACGQEFESWDFILGIYRDNPKTCPKCGRQLYFSVSVRVLEVAPPNNGLHTDGANVTAISVSCPRCGLTFSEPLDESPRK